MGITTNNFFENIYSVIFSPKAFFEREDISYSIRLSIATVIFIAVINKLAMGIFDSSILHWTFFFAIIGSAIITVMLWFLTALFFEYIAKIFEKDGQLKKLLFYTAFVPIPYLFFAPLNLLKNTNDVLYIIATLAEFCIYIWIIYLYILSLKTVYCITKARACMMILIPFISSFFAIYWIVCFCGKLWYIFSI